MRIYREQFVLALRLGAAALASAILLSGPARADEAGDLTPKGPDSQAAPSREALVESGSGPILGPLSGYCSASGQTPTGRQKALVTVSPRDATLCVRIKLGGMAEIGTPDCWQVAHALGCDEVVDLN